MRTTKLLFTQESQGEGPPWGSVQLYRGDPGLLAVESRGSIPRAEHLLCTQPGYHHRQDRQGKKPQIVTMTVFFPVPMTKHQQRQLLMEGEDCFRSQFREWATMVRKLRHGGRVPEAAGFTGSIQHNGYTTGAQLPPPPLHTVPLPAREWHRPQWTGPPTSFTPSR